jgi:hypothetical protein
MRRLLPLLLLPVLLLASCAEGETGSGTGSAELGTVTGHVLAGPNCPVQMTASPCPDTPLPGEVVQLVSGDTVVETATSDSEGAFTMQAVPGDYELRWAPAEDVGVRFAKPLTVTVVAGETVTADLLVDTGIR